MLDKLILQLEILQSKITQTKQQIINELNSVRNVDKKEDGEQLPKPK